MKTYFAKTSDIERRWWVVDVSGKTLGRAATEIATLLRGKGKPIYSPHSDVGDFVVVVNAAKVHVTGRKAKQKIYYRHSNYPGGLKTTTLEKMLQAHPTEVIRHAVKGMLSHNRQGRAVLRRLRVYAGDTHPHQAQVEAQRRG